MKKLLMCGAVAAMFGAMAPVAQAATAGPTNFNVTVALTSKCEITSISNVAFTYTSFQPGNAIATPGVIDLRCTNSLPYTLALDANLGSVIGLNYTLALPSAAGIGTGTSNVTHTITGGMVSGQSGNCATTATCNGTDNTRTLTVTY